MPRILSVRRALCILRKICSSIFVSLFDLADPDNIARAVQGENVGTLVYEG